MDNAGLEDVRVAGCAGVEVLRRQPVMGFM